MAVFETSENNFNASLRPQNLKQFHEHRTFLWQRMKENKEREKQGEILEGESNEGGEQGEQGEGEKENYKESNLRTLAEDDEPRIAAATAALSPVTPGKPQLILKRTSGSHGSGLGTYEDYSESDEESLQTCKKICLDPSMELDMGTKRIFEGGGSPSQEFLSTASKSAKDSLWQRVGKKVSTVGKGLLCDETAKMLLTEHWLEVADPKHRYGSILKHYHELWKLSDSSQNFFHWLDYGDGKEINLEEAPRRDLNAAGVKYLSEQQRAQYLVEVKDGKLRYKQSGTLVDTTSSTSEDKPVKWIFVVDTKGNLYIAKKIKGQFHHSSFLSGGPAKVAGNLTAHHGNLIRVSRSSGHYRPSQQDLDWFLKSLQLKGLDISNVAVEELRL